MRSRRTAQLQVYCLPDNYEVQDRSLDDIRYVLNPKFTQQDVARLDQVSVGWVRAHVYVHACACVCVCVCLACDCVTVCASAQACVHVQACV